MKMVYPVVWHEGLLLGQQHFQAMDRALVHQRRLDLQTFHPYTYGIGDLVIDSTALKGGIFKVIKLRALFPDGRWLEFDDNLVEVELVLNLDDQEETIYICWPFNNKVARLSGYPKNESNAAWQVQYQELADENDHARKREVALACPNVFLTQNKDKSKQCSSISLARIAKNKHQHIQSLIAYTPPCLMITSALPIWHELKKFSLWLRDKAFRQDRHEAIALHQEITIAHLIQWQMSRCHVQLELKLESQCAEPYHLFLELNSLKSSIEAFDNIDRQKEIDYQHDAINESFSELISSIKCAIAALEKNDFTCVRFFRQKKNIWISDRIPTDLFQGKQFILCVQQHSLAFSFYTLMQNLKISSPQSIAMVVASAVQGIELNSVSSPLAKQLNSMHYEGVSLAQEGQYWQQIINEEKLALHIPEAYQDAEYHLIIMDKKE